jgi:secretion/DNA translocation related TadE-like protein
MTGHDQGSASVLLLAVGLVLLGAGLAAASVGTAHVTRHQAQIAADLGALAGATHSALGPHPACQRAASIVGANGGRIIGCELDGLDLTVTVQVEPATGLSRPATATARAGPVRADDSRGGAASLLDDH